MHCHSTLSDGKWTPEKIKAEYKKRGYSVVCITDHERLVSHHDLTDEDLLFLTGYEAYIRTMPFDYKKGVQSHMNLYSKTPENKMLYYTPDHTKYIPEAELATLQYHKFMPRREYTAGFVEQTVKDAIACGFLVCHNHPTWSFEEEGFADAYGECFAMELYNHNAYIDGFAEYNQHYYERQIRRGRKMAAIAADDNHDVYPTDSPRNDSFGGVTYILADRLEYGAVIEAMERKDFYASTGPRIYSLTAENGTLRVKTSEAVQIAFSCDSRRRGVENGAVTEAAFTPDETVEWVRVEVTDKQGKKAFSRAYFKEEWVD